MPVDPIRRGRRAGLAALAAVVALMAASCGDDDGATRAVPSTATSAPAAEDAAVAPVPDRGAPVTCADREHATEARADHVPLGTDVDFEHVPPAAGPHSLEVSATGVLDEPAPYLMQVAALEVGFVIVQYTGELRPDETAALDAMAVEVVELIVMPSPGPIDDGARVAATTWERRILCDGVDAEALRTFFDERNEPDGRDER